MEIKIERGWARCFAHGEEGLREMSSEDAILLLIGDKDELTSLTRLETGDHSYRVDLDTRRCLAIFPEGYQDPISFFPMEDKWAFTVFLTYRTVDQLTHGANQLTISPIIVYRGQTVVDAVCSLSQGRQKGEWPFTSRLIRRKVGDWFLWVNASEDFDIVWQSSQDGRSIEVVHPYQKGRWKIPLPVMSGDFMGVCVTTKDVIGGYEDKWQIFGQAGVDRGRWEWNADGLKEAHGGFLYRALTVNAPIPQEILDQFDEWKMRS